MKCWIICCVGGSVSSWTPASHRNRSRSNRIQTSTTSQKSRYCANARKRRSKRVTAFDHNTSTRTSEQRPNRLLNEVSSAGEPLTLAEAQYELGIDPQAALVGTPRQDQEDAAVTALITEARAWCENQCDRTLRETVVREFYLDELPHDPVEFWRPPLISVDSYQYRDTDSVYQTIDPASYMVMATTESNGFMQFAGEYSRPDTYKSLDAVKITYTAGYGEAAKIPPEAKAAVKLMLTVLWDHDENKDLLAVYAERAQNLLESLRWGSYE